MGRQRREHGPSFDDSVRDASSADGQETVIQPWPQPIRDGRWIDGEGIHWHTRGKRGAQLSRSALRRLLKLPALQVLHVYGPNPAEVRGPECKALLERVETYLAGQAPPHNAFRLAEFRTSDHRAMLVIEEAC
ncbi:hypothetical protein [Actinoplanes regularis]|uniref:hypothetical protein n=1 Tax=Actinoplanes regularis TaxID=52697 RepID=UPI0011776C60|nr:hypothetical protein [Actinoplanes regularis]GIE85595.1 hypothetical protein Are01nite_20750 [Actinoplanes regularis]